MVEGRKWAYWLQRVDHARETLAEIGKNKHNRRYRRGCPAAGQVGAQEEAEHREQKHNRPGAQYSHEEVLWRHLRLNLGRSQNRRTACTRNHQNEKHDNGQGQRLNQHNLPPGQRRGQQQLQRAAILLTCQRPCTRNQPVDAQDNGQILHDGRGQITLKRRHLYTHRLIGGNVTKGRQLIGHLGVDDNIHGAE